MKASPPCCWLQRWESKEVKKRGNAVAGNVTEIYNGKADQAGQDMESNGHRGKLEGEFLKRLKGQTKNSQSINLPAGALYHIQRSL